MASFPLLRFQDHLVVPVAAGAFLTLACLPGSVESRQTPGLLLAALLTIWAYYVQKNGKGQGELYPPEVFPRWPAFPWIVFGIAALTLRFGFPPPSGSWPLEDEGMNAGLAWDLARHGGWNPFPFFTGTPPLFFWAHAIFFKFIQPSLDSIHLFPAILSLSASGAAYAAARGWFKPRQALWAWALWAIAFWPAFIGRHDTLEGFFLVWELVALGTMGLWWNRRGKTGAHAWSALFGLTAGIGLWISHHAPMVIFPTILGVAAGSLRRKQRSPIDFMIFLGIVLASALLLLAARRGSFFPDYLQSLWSGIPEKDFTGQCREGGRYLAATFWGSDPPTFAYRPNGSGYLSPVMGALAILGLGTALTRLRLDSARFLVLGVALGWMPGFLTRLTEFFRMSHIVPFLLLAALVGLGQFLSSVAPNRRSWAAGALLALSLAWDLGHFARARDAEINWAQPRLSGPRSQTRAKAYAILRNQYARQGPGRLFDRLAPDPWDGSLGLAVHSMRIPASHAAWFGVVLERDLAAALVESWPGSRLETLGLGGSPPRPLALVVGPRRNGEPGLAQWETVDEAFRPVVREILAHKDGSKHGKVLEALGVAAPTARGNRILEALVWLRLSEQWHLQGQIAHRHPEILGYGSRRDRMKELLDAEINALTRSVGSCRGEPALGWKREAEDFRRLAFPENRSR